MGIDPNAAEEKEDRSADLFYVGIGFREGVIVFARAAQEKIVGDIQARFPGLIMGAKDVLHGKGFSVSRKHCFGESLGAEFGMGHSGLRPGPDNSRAEAKSAS